MMMRTVVFALLLLTAVTVFPQGNAATARRFVGAFNSRDAGKMLMLTTDDVKWMTIAGEKLTTETSGKSALRSFLENYFKTCVSCRSTISRLTENGNRVTMTETASWRTGTGVQKSDSFAVYEFSGGKIARVYYYREPDKSGYDEALAKRLGADERGMKKLVFVNLVRGKAVLEKAERDKYIQGHLENIGRLADSGKLVLAGPFMDAREIRGIYIFDVATIEKAKELVETDPAVKAGVFEFEMRLWYGSAALLELNRIHRTLEKK